MSPASTSWRIRAWLADKAFVALMEQPRELRVGRRGHLVLVTSGCCGRCETPWGFVKPHATPYGPVGPNGTHRTLSAGVLCNRCWADLTPRERLPFYVAWHREQMKAYAGLPSIERDEGLKRMAVLRASLESAVWEGK